MSPQGPLPKYTEVWTALVISTRSKALLIAKWVAWGVIWIIFLQSLSLLDKLRFNKNGAGQRAFPIGSDDRASFVTIPEEDMAKLKKWQFWKCVKDEAPLYLAVNLAPFHEDDELTEANLQRPAEDDANEHVAKRPALALFKVSGADYYKPYNRWKGTRPYHPRQFSSSRTQ
ncbi:hypothetical protein BKA70DRAFT_1436072 [Coprinopsis sp. MPI-PUGE-AT-0042]|nr:hypothetical protein BKA70DRAFT_1436072 [Coprinopsis sp. MPI-PUGE-AT-0042]